MTKQKVFKEILPDDVNVIDEAENDLTVPVIRYDITSFGADYDVDGLVRRMKRKEIYAPPFQRGYVWNIKQGSRFVESLLLASYPSRMDTTPSELFSFLPVYPA